MEDGIRMEEDGQGDKQQIQQLFIALGGRRNGDILMLSRPVFWSLYLAAHGKRARIRVLLGGGQASNTQIEISSFFIVYTVSSPSVAHQRVGLWYT